MQYIYQIRGSILHENHFFRIKRSKSSNHRTQKAKVLHCIAEPGFQIFK